MKTIELEKTVYFANVIWTIDFYDIKLPEWLVKALKKQNVISFPGSSCKSRYIKIVTACDHSNPYNSPKYIVDRNARLLSDILAMDNIKVIKPSKSRIFLLAWNKAREAAEEFGGKARDYFGSCLKQVYKDWC